MTLALPLAHVFEEMRAILVDGAVDLERMGQAAAFTPVYLAAALSILLHVFGIARRRGMLLQMGE